MTTPEDQAIIDAAVKAQLAQHVPVQTITPGVFPVVNLKSQANWRAFFHSLVAVVVPVLVTMDIATETQVAAWVPFIFAIADNVLSAKNTKDKVRLAIYSAFGVLQTGGLATVLLGSSHPEIIPIVSAVMAIGSSFMARFYTPTTTIKSA